MSADHIVLMLKALADPTRLRIFEFLRSGCCEVCVDDRGDVRPILQDSVSKDGVSQDAASSDGSVTVGEVCYSVLGTERIPSSLSFHLKELRTSGLIEMKKQGRYVFCKVNREAETKLANFFRKNEILGAREDQ